MADDTDPSDTWDRSLYERHLAVSSELIDMGLALARAAHDMALASASESLTPLSMTYSNVMRRALETPG